MTDTDAAIDTRRAGALDSQRPGLWRVLSFLLVLIAAGLVATWILQSRSASDVAVQNSRTLDVTVTEVVVADLPSPDGARVAVLGVDAQRPVDVVALRAELEVPSRVPSVVALLDERGGIRGLSLVSRPEDQTPVTLSAATTAHALLALSPAMLEADIERSRQRVEFIESDPAVLALVDALRVGSDLSIANEPVEQALAAILDRVPVTALPDQGCDSILNARAVAVAGACAEPTGDTVTVHNEQDRWAVAFGGPEPFAEPCAVIAPEGEPGRSQQLSTSDCGPETLIAAAGPIIDRSADRAAVIDRIHAATSLQVFAEHLAPLVDLTGGQAGLNRSSNTHILTSYEALVSLADDLSADDPGFSAALDVIIDASSPVERHAAVLGASRALLTGADSVIDDWRDDAGFHLAVLDFYDRVGEQMLADDRSDRRWTADSWGVIPLEGAP